MKNFFVIAMLLLCSALFVPKAPASGIPVFDAANVANTLLTAQRTLEQVQNQLKMLESLNFDASGEIFQVLNQTQAVLDQVQGVAYNIDQISDQFENFYPEDMEGMSYDDLVNLKDNLLVQTRNAQQHAMQIQASVASSMPQTQATVGALVQQSNSAVGPTSAMQANTQLLATVSAQLTQMQSLLMAQTRALNAQIQEQNSRTQAAKEQQKIRRTAAGGEVESGIDSEKLFSFDNN